MLGDPTETGTVSALVEATVHLRKTVAADGGQWYNAQGDAGPALWPSPAPVPVGSFDDAPVDAGDGVPVYPAGSLVRFQVWLEELSGAVTWPVSNGPMILDDNGTPGDKLDDWAPVLVAGDDGDGFLAGGEVWVLESPAPITATAGQQYRNMSVLYPGLIHRYPSNPTGPIEGYSQFRQDPAGFEVPAIATSVDAPVGAPGG